MATKVSEKSTKTEIWAAYKELLDELQSGSIAVAGDNVKIGELGLGLEQSKSELLAKFEAAREAVNSAADDYAAAEQMLNKRKSEIIDDLERSRTELQASIDQVRKDWELQEADRKRNRDREAEEYSYNLSKKRRADEEAFQAKWQAKSAELNNREATIKEKEERLAELEQAAQKAPEELQKAVTQAREELARELKTTHEAKLKETAQQFDYQKNILELKLQTAEAASATKDKQLIDLQKQLDSASAQLKDMAVTVIRASNTQSQVQSAGNSSS